MTISEWKRTKHKGRGKRHSFLALPHFMLKSAEFASLSGNSVKLLLELAAQYDGKNNGNLSATSTTLAERGWSPATIARAKVQLIEAGFVLKTRQGHRHACDLFAITWQPVDACDGKHQEPVESVPSHRWQKIKTVVR